MRLSRRRFLIVAAAAAGAAVVGSRSVRTVTERYGVALGAPAELRLVGVGGAAADRLEAMAWNEVERLEQVFSLFRDDSALVALNRDGHLDRPPPELVEVLEVSGRVHEASDGAFDPTVQPLWRVVADHFARPGADPRGPAPEALRAAARLVGLAGVEVTPRRVAFARPRMAMTLNGIGQGYITDRVCDMLRREGLRDILVAMGEIRVQGHNRDGDPWRVGIEGRDGFVALTEGGVATSGPEGTRFSPQFHHLFDPATGRSAAPHTVSVLAANATLADAASTALAILPPGRRAAVAEALEVRIL